MNGTTNVWDKPLTKGRGEVSLSAYSFLFSEFVQHTRSRVDDVNRLEERLSDVGYQVGIRSLELMTFREKNHKREIKIVSMLQFISQVVWKTYFGSVAKLEQSIQHKDEYMLRMKESEEDISINKFISIPNDFGGLNCAAFVAGLVKGVLDCADFVSLIL